MSVYFYPADESIRMPRLRRRLVAQWLEQVAQSYDKSLGELTYQLCSDEQILSANRQFLEHDYYTDIITFDNSDGNTISGDMLISLDTVRSNAQMLGVSFAEELHRVLVHGVLHMIGLGDKTDQEEQEMRTAEDKALELLYTLLGGGKPLLY